MSIKRIYTVISVTLPFIYVVYSLAIKNYENTINAALTLLCVSIFLLIHNKLRFINGLLYYGVLALLFLSVFAGKTLNFYATIPHWDKYLHFLSGFIFVGIGNELYQKTTKHYSPSYIRRLFPLLFAISAAGLWEIWEFSGDKLFGLSAQNNSLTDTMTDMILGSLSSVIAIMFIKKTSL